MKQSPPTPFERYQTWLQLLQWIRGEINREKQLEQCTLDDEDLKDLALKFMKSDIDEIEKEKNRVSSFLKLEKPDQVKTQLITISIDKKLEPTETADVQFKVIEKIKSANYKCLDNVSHKFEYYTENGWNPHIHIMTDKIKAKSYVAQLIDRKLKNAGLHEAYRVNVSELNHEAHDAYMNGVKKESKQEFVIKDEVFRETHDIEDIYYWKNT